ncbi:unnamed protein product [Arctogadus glacialis]
MCVRIERIDAFAHVQRHPEGNQKSPWLAGESHPLPSDAQIDPLVELRSALGSQEWSSGVCATVRITIEGKILLLWFGHGQRQTREVHFKITQGSLTPSQNKPGQLRSDCDWLDAFLTGKL